FGHEYESLLVSVKGTIYADTTSLPSSPWSNQQLPTAATNSYNKVIMAPFWGDLLTNGATSRVYTEFFAVPGGVDYFIIQFHEMGIWNNSGTSLTFQVVLFADGSFEYRYADMLPVTNSLAQGHARTIGYQFPFGSGREGSTFHYGGPYTSSPANPGNVVPGGISNRTLRYEPMPLSGSISVTPTTTTTYKACAAESGYSECTEVTVVVPEPGDLAITEVMVDPAGGPSHQWIEVRNLGPGAIDLAGWTIESNSGSHTIQNSIVVAPGEFATFAASSAVSFLPDELWGASISLDPLADEIKLKAGGEVIASVEWNSSWAIPADTALALEPIHHQRGVVSHGPSSWCFMAAAESPGALGDGCRFEDYLVDAAPWPVIDISLIGVSVPGLTAYLTHGSATLSFPFPFFGETYTDVSISSNGFVAMVPSISTTYPANVSLPSTAEPASFGIIAPFWDEASYSRHNGTFRMAEVMVDGQMVAVLQWNNLGPWTGSSSKTTFQAQLWESGDIVFLYLDLSGDTTTAFGSSATVGIQAPGATGTPSAVQVSFDQPVLRPGTVYRFIQR
ncbi:MAG TPA: lamin tail domain-containing protein, partial [Vulgatibacter sp.]|nr:lamin tail domain-containing protein [Vulgatibacter sp.]